MERRKFLHLFFGGAAVAAAPKFIFDMGKNLYVPPMELTCVEWKTWELTPELLEKIYQAMSRTVQKLNRLEGHYVIEREL